MSESTWVAIGIFVAGLLWGGYKFLYKQGNRSIKQVASDAGDQRDVLRDEIDALEQELGTVEATARNGRNELQQKIDRLRKDVNENTISKSQFRQFERRFDDLRKQVDDARDDVRSLSQEVKDVPERVANFLNKMNG